MWNQSLKPLSQKISRILPLAIVFFVVGISPAYAYLDPGTAGMLLQLLLGGVAGAAVVLKLYWTRLKAKLFGSKPNSHQDDERKA